MYQIVSAFLHVIYLPGQLIINEGAFNDVLAGIHLPIIDHQKGLVLMP